MVLLVLAVGIGSAFVAHKLTTKRATTPATAKQPSTPTQGSGIWTGGNLPLSSLNDPNESFLDVSCASNSFCAAVGENGGDSSYTGVVWTFDGTAWTTPTTVDAAAALSYVSCPSATFCLAIDSNADYLLFDGTSWSAPQPIGATAYSYTLYGLSCASAALCMAVGALNTGPDNPGLDAAVWQFDGSTWSTADILAQDAALLSVSCISSSFCKAVGATDTPSAGIIAPALAYTFNGSLWPEDQLPGGLMYPLISVSCASNLLCAAVAGSRTGGISQQNSDTPGEVLVYQNSGWSVPETVDPNSLVDASCATQTFCMLADDIGQTLTFNGSSWTRPHQTPAFGFQAMDCAPSGLLCVGGVLQFGAVWHGPS